MKVEMEMQAKEEEAKRDEGEDEAKKEKGEEGPPAGPLSLRPSGSGRRMAPNAGAPAHLSKMILLVLLLLEAGTPRHLLFPRGAR